MRLSRTSLGEAAVAAKSRITDLETRRTWMLFGNPTLFGVPTAVPPPPMDGGADAGVPDAGVGMTRARRRARRWARASRSTRARPTSERRPTGAPIRSSRWMRLRARRRRRRRWGRRPRGHTSAARRLRLQRRRRFQLRRRRARPLAVRYRAGRAAPAAARPTRARRRVRRRAADRPRLGGARGGGLQLAHGDHDRSHAHRHVDGRHDALELSAAARHHERQPQELGGRRPCHEHERIRHQLSGRRHDHLRWCFDLHLQLRDRELHLHGFFRSRDRVGQHPRPEDSREHGEHGHLRQVRRRHGHDADPEPERHLELELQGRLAPQSGGVAPDRRDGHALERHIQRRPGARYGHRAHQLGRQHEQHDGTAYLDYRSTKFNWTSSDTFTYQGWFKTTDATGPLFSQRDNGAGNPDIDITVGYNGGTTNADKMSVLVRDDTGASYAEVNGRRPSATTSGTTSRSPGPAARSSSTSTVRSSIRARTRARPATSRPRAPAITRTSGGKGTGCRRPTA